MVMRYRAAFFSLAICLVVGLSLSGASAAADYDIIFAHARVIDGTGAPWFRADVAVRGDRIVAVGDLSTAPAARRIDIHDRVIAPGFIDLLGQSEMQIRTDFPLKVQ